MPQITGRFNNNTLTGIVRFTPDHTFNDVSTNPVTVVIFPYEAPITNGSFTITVPQSQKLAGQSNIMTEGVTYKIDFLRVDNTPLYYFTNGQLYDGLVNQDAGGVWWTGSVKTNDSVRLDRIQRGREISFQDSIHAIIPDTNSVIDFSTLINVPIIGSNQDIGIYRIVEALSTIPRYRDRISSKFAFKGVYSATASYVFGDVVTFNGNSYIWINSNSGTGRTPPVNSDTNWQLLAEKGNTGTGITAQIVGWNASTWANNPQAASMGDVASAINSIPRPDLSLYATIAESVPRNNAIFTGSTKRSVLNFPIVANEKQTEIPTIDYVEKAIQSMGVNKFPKPILFAQIRNNIILSNGGVGSITQTVVWDTIIINNNILQSNGTIVIPSQSSYIFACSLFVRTRASGAEEGTKIITRCFLNRITSPSVEIGNFWRNEARAVFTSSLLFNHFGLRYQDDLNQGIRLDVRINLSVTGGRNLYAGDGDEPPSIIGSVGNNYLLMWDVS